MRHTGLGPFSTGLLTGSFLLTAAPVQAYLDPGTGSMMLQAAIGAVAGAFVAVRVYWTRIKGAFTGSRRSRPDDPSSTD